MSRLRARDRLAFTTAQVFIVEPSAAGSYLAACVLYAAVTGRSPEGAPSEIVGGRWGGSPLWVRVRSLFAREKGVPLVSLDRGTALHLQRVAWTVVGERAAPRAPR